MKNSYAFALLLLLSACSFKVDKTATDSADSSTSAAKSSFAQVSSQVIAVSCLKCHSTTAPVMTTYAQTKAAMAAIQRAVFVTKSMPKNGSLSATQLAILSTWLANGAPEFPTDNSSASPSSSDSSNATSSAASSPNWKDVQQQVVNVSCAGCHSPHNTHGISDFTDLKTFRASISTILFSTLVDKEKPMPPPPRELTVEQKRLIADWVIAGQLDENNMPPSDASPSPTPDPTKVVTSYHLNPDNNGNEGIQFTVGYLFANYKGTVKEAKTVVQAKTDPSFSLTQANFSLPVSSLDLGNAEHNCYLQEALSLDYSKSNYPRAHVCDSNNKINEALAYPTIDFSLENLPVNANLDTAPVDLQVNGKFTIHGVSKEVSGIPLHLEYDQGSKQRIHVTSQFKLFLNDYGVTVKPIFLNFNADNTVEIHLDFILHSDQELAPGPFDEKSSVFAPSTDANANQIAFDIGYFAGVHHGEAKAVSGSAELTLGKNFLLKNAKFEVPLASIGTDNTTRDCHVRETLGIDYTHSRYPNDHVCDSNNKIPETGPDSVAYPDITIELMSFDAPEKSLAPGDSLVLQTKMRIAIHGVTKENVAVPLTLKYSDPTKGEVIATSKFPLSLKDFGAVVKPVFGSVGNVNDEADVSISLVLLPEPSH